MSAKYPCPYCGRDTGIFDSRQKGQIRERKRYCKGGHTFVTWEVLKDERGTERHDGGVSGGEGGGCQVPELPKLDADD